ncbi:MAG TPA: isoprenylcysteine carboxylmethyltransferase family protein [Caldilineae bacterium]|nr:isoprenylcysteine carboxylmethyltransferase family protein [Caldilineae bacterium]
MSAKTKLLRMTSALNTYKQSRREWAINILAAVYWAIYAMAYLQRSLSSRDFMSLGLGAYYSLVVWLFITREPAKRSASWPVTIFVLCSMILPVIGLAPSSQGFPVLGGFAQGLGLIGMFAATASLGRSFAIAPADRGLRTNGLYRWIRHPLYASELLFYVGYLLANWSWRNGLVLIVAVIFVMIRIHLEEQLIEGYQQYAERVRWRLIPRVW